MYVIYTKFKYHIIIFAVVILSCFMAVSQVINVKADSNEWQLHSVPKYDVNADGDYIYYNYTTSGYVDPVYHGWTASYWYYNTENFNPKRVEKFKISTKWQGDTSGYYSAGSPSYYIFYDADTGDALTSTASLGTTLSENTWVALPEFDDSVTNVYARIVTGCSYAAWNGVYASKTLSDFRVRGVKTPSITEDIPTTKTYNSQDSLSLSVNAIGAEPIYYQWYENDTAMAGATGPTLYLGEQEGLRYNNSKFYCKITNEFGTTTSQTCVVKANVGTFKPFVYTVNLGDTDKTSTCEVIADINYAYYVSFPATLTLEPADLDKDLPTWKKVFSRQGITSFSDSELKEDLTTEMYSEPDFYTSNFFIKAKATTEGLGNKYIHVYTEPTEESKQGLDEETIEALTDLGPDLSIKGAAILRDIEDSSKLEGVFITQDTVYFGNSSNKFVAPISSSKWSSIAGLAGANIEDQGCYKGNFNFVYGLVDADTAEIPD